MGDWGECPFLHPSLLFDERACIFDLLAKVATVLQQSSHYRVRSLSKGFFFILSLTGSQETVVATLQSSGDLFMTGGHTDGNWKEEGRESGGKARLILLRLI